MLRRLLKTVSLVGLLIGWALPAYAEEAVGGLDTGDTAWLLISTALVIAMTVPGLALFYGGLVSQRNILSMLMQCFFVLALISVQWVLWGYTLSFGSSVAGIIGGFDYLGLRGVGAEPIGGATIPHLGFAMFQMAFAVITVALITGSFAERMRFPAFLLFSLLWATLVYNPLAHWVWGGGWLAGYGVLDFAGGTVVHISSGVSALVAAKVIGRRLGYPERVAPPHNLPLTVTGAAMLWIGWFGFNAGSALGSNGLAAIAFAVTNTSAATAAVVWAFADWVRGGKPTVLGTATGAVAGLVAITPAAGYVSVGSALVIGAVAGLVCYWGVTMLKPRWGLDDALDVFAVHGLGGIWGALATGIFASESINPAGASGLLYGNPAQLGVQCIGVLAGVALAAVGTFIILRVVAAVTPLRVSREEELAGLDRSLHGEAAYNFGFPVAPASPAQAAATGLSFAGLGGAELEQGAHD
ncbi:MAG TPA: ammonium transporter [Bacillota bacterium]